MCIVLYISVSGVKGPSMHVSKATASTVIATGNLRQGRLMADHGGLCSNSKLWQIGAKEGQGGMRAHCFSYCKRETRRGTVVEKGDCGRAELRPLMGCVLLIVPW
jgi:hypothetical protein